MRLRGDDVQLSGREREVAGLIYAGLTDPLMALALRIGEPTVSGYVVAIMRGLELSTRGQLVLWLAQHPRAVMEGQWSDWRTHPAGCGCTTLPYCSFARLELGKLAA